MNSFNKVIEWKLFEILFNYYDNKLHEFNGDIYPDRVYLYLKFNYNKLENYAKDLFKNKQTINNVIILKIDLKVRCFYIEGNKIIIYSFFDEQK